MNINHLRDHTLKSAILMEQEKFEVSTFAEKKIKSINTSHDLPSTSCNVTTYMQFLPPSLLSRIKAEPNFIENCIKNLDVAIKNNAERRETKAKCAIIKILLEGSSLENVFDFHNSICGIYRANLKLVKKEVIASMLEYYLVGGLKLLRGFPCTPLSPLYPASVMNFILTRLEKNPVFASGLSINEELKERIARGECFENINAATIPTVLTINNFITACEYKKNQRNAWFLPLELTGSTASISQKINFAVLPKLQQMETAENNSLDELCKVKISCSEYTKSAILTNLELAIENNFETENNRVKFIAVKMLLTGFAYGEIIRQCGYLYTECCERSISWDPEKLDSLLHSYFLGGLRFLRAFSLQSRLTFSQLKTINFLISLVEADPSKGSTAILSLYKRMEAAEQLPLGIDKSSCLPSNDVFHHFLIRCGYKRTMHEWTWDYKLTPNIFLDELQQAQSIPITSAHLPVGDQSLLTEENETEDSIMPYKLFRNSMELVASPMLIPQEISFDPVSLEQSVEPIGNTSADQAMIGLFDEKMMAHEKALEANDPKSEKNSLAELARLLLSFESLSSSSSKCSLEDISNHIEDSKLNLFEFQLEAIQDVQINTNTEQRLEMNSNELTPLPDIDGRDLFEFLSEYDSQERAEFQLKNTQNININSNAETKFEISSQINSHSLHPNSKDLCDPSYQSYLQETQAMMSSVSNELLFESNLNTFDLNSNKLKLQQSLLEQSPIQNDAPHASLMNEFEVNKEPKSTDEKPSTSLNCFSLMPTRKLSLKEQIDILKVAIANRSESDLNRIKFTAVKMLLEGKYSDELIARKCNSLFVREHKNRNMTWNRGKFMLLRHYYLKGGLTVLRGFSFKSLPRAISAEIMSLIVRLVEENPHKGSMAILKMMSQMNMNIDTSALPLHTAVDKFLARAGYQRIQKRWVFDPTLTTNILPNNLQEEQISSEASLNTISEKTTKRHSSEKLQLLPYKKIRKMSAELEPNFSNQEKSNLFKSISDNLEAAIGNNLEKIVDKNKFTAVKMLLDGFPYEDISNHCNFPLTRHAKKNIFWTPEKLELLLDSYLQGGLCLVRAFSFQSHHDATLQKKMGFILKLFNENLGRGSSAILTRIKKMNEAGEVPEGIDVSSLPSHGALDAFITRCGYERILRSRWVFRSCLTPNLPFYGLRKEQIMKQTDLEDQSKTASEQSSHAKIKFH